MDMVFFPMALVTSGGLGMNFDQYAKGARETAIYPGRGELNGLLYAVIGLSGESGELCNKIKKILRDSNGHISYDIRNAIAGELGDILWYVAAVCDELDYDIDLIATLNLAKLRKRLLEGTIGGSGDNR